MNTNVYRETRLKADLEFETTKFQRAFFSVGNKGRATIDEIIDALHLLDRDSLESFYLNKVLPWDKRSIREILGGSETPLPKEKYNENK
tara:strand:+ start:130 stop:396 length:267 start_codon:yes stop_codon:yes gene_type:complete